MTRVSRVGQSPEFIVARDRPVIAQWLADEVKDPAMEQYIGAIAELEVASLLGAICVADGIHRYDLRVPNGRYRGRIEVKATMAAKFNYRLRGKAAKWVARVRLERVGNELWIQDAKIGPRYSQFYPCRSRAPWKTIPGFKARKV